jgi:hypothetical protein
LFDISCHSTPIEEKPFALDNPPENIGCNHEPFFVDFFLQCTAKLGIFLGSYIGAHYSDKIGNVWLKRLFLWNCFDNGDKINDLGSRLTRSLKVSGDYSLFVSWE